jgi:hypothetical protein
MSSLHEAELQAPTYHRSLALKLPMLDFVCARHIYVFSEPLPVKLIDHKADRADVYTGGVTELEQDLNFIPTRGRGGYGARTTDDWYINPLFHVSYMSIWFTYFLYIVSHPRASERTYPPCKSCSGQALVDPLVPSFQPLPSWRIAIAA